MIKCKNCMYWELKEDVTTKVTEGVYEKQHGICRNKDVPYNMIVGMNGGGLRFHQDFGCIKGIEN